MSYIAFGSGLLFVNPIGANLAPNPTPTQPLTLQDLSIDISSDVKELRGRSQFPDDVAPADKKGTGKFSFGRVDVPLFNQMFFAESKTAGGTVMAPLEEHSVPASTPYTATVTNAVGFIADYGVSYIDGSPFERVASAPTAGQYSQAAGVYTFAAADAGKAILISYSYTVASAGATVTVSNKHQGYGPTVELVFVQDYQTVAGVPSSIRLFAAKVTKLALAMKRVDYTMPECDFSYFANPQGKVMEMYTNQ